MRSLQQQHCNNKKRTQSLRCKTKNNEINGDKKIGELCLSVVLLLQLVAASHPGTFSKRVKERQVNKVDTQCRSREYLSLNL